MQAPNPQPLDPKILEAKVNEILKALEDAKLVADEITLTALGNILISFCVNQGVSKKQFMQIMKDTWRSFSTLKQNHDAMRKKLEKLPQETLEKMAMEVAQTPDSDLPGGL